MGNGSSFHTRNDDLDIMLEVEHYIPPSFHTFPKIIPDQSRLCQECWDRIKEGNTLLFKSQTPESKNESEEEPCGDQGAETFFVSDFYRFLFDRLPSTEPLFKNITKQYVMFGKVIDIIISSCNQQQVASEMLVALTEQHNQMKIHPAFYGEFCYSFLVTMKKHFGTEWTNEMNHAWCTMFSVILRVMVPVAVKGLNEWTKSDGVAAQALSLCEVGDAPPQSLSL
uniref:Globin domain-containing protein n=1 Tax=Fibrocapsa japonica TaxID=94617 RepID=A0A7S2V6Q0_9STRA|mmetsp:Transcript_9639/g.14812  ORF Transcript_9639/g.14812 Transcript_9639/m.14812 type:complete len:225 (+) Transcript_9639:87-761(+)